MPPKRPYSQGPLIGAHREKKIKKMELSPGIEPSATAGLQQRGGVEAAPVSTSLIRRPCGPPNSPRWSTAPGFATKR